MTLPEQRPETQSRDAGTPGIIDTLGNGFALLSRRPYLVWLPVVLDLLLWSGFRVSVIQPTRWLTSQIQWSTGPLANFSGSLRDALVETELVQLVGALTPTLISELGVANVSELSILSQTILGGESGLLALILGITAMVFLGVSYLTMIARLVIDRPAWGFQFVADCVANSFRFVGVIVSVSAFLCLLFAPFVALGVGMHFIGVDITTALTVIGFMMLIWAVVFFFFSAHAITVDHASAVEAMRSSYGLVYRHLLSVLALLVIVLVIRIGTPMALQVFTETRWSVPFAIIVNAYIATGLVAATMIYFRDRSRTLFTPAGARTAGPRS